MSKIKNYTSFAQRKYYVSILTLAKFHQLSSFSHLSISTLVYGWMDGRISGWMDGRMGGWEDGWVGE